MPAAPLRPATGLPQNVVRRYWTDIQSFILCEGIAPPRDSPRLDEHAISTALDDKYHEHKRGRDNALFPRQCRNARNAKQHKCMLEHERCDDDISHNCHHPTGCELHAILLSTQTARVVEPPDLAVAQSAPVLEINQRLSVWMRPGKAEAAPEHIFALRRCAIPVRFRLNDRNKMVPVGYADAHRYANAIARRPIIRRSVLVRNR